LYPAAAVVTADSGTGSGADYVVGGARPVAVDNGRYVTASAGSAVPEVKADYALKTVKSRHRHHCDGHF